MNRELLQALVHASAEIQEAHRKALDAGRHDVARKIRSAGVDVANAIALLVPDRAAVIS